MREARLEILTLFVRCILLVLYQFIDQKLHVNVIRPYFWYQNKLKVKFQICFGVLSTIFHWVTSSFILNFQRHVILCTINGVEILR
jgi:hypothetical protein